MTDVFERSRDLSDAGDALRKWLESQGLANRRGVQALILELAGLIAEEDDAWGQLGLACAALTGTVVRMITPVDDDDEGDDE